MSAVPALPSSTPQAKMPPVSVPRLSARLAPAAIFCAWFALSLWLVAGHEMWRDEVRALSFAIDPPTLWAMLDGLRGEGHPALWYLILRGGYALTGSMLVLPVAAFVASAAGMAVLLWRAPFHPLLKVLLAASAFLAIEYPVVARNYGISLLPILLFAATYDSWRRKGIGLGLVLAVLANTNVHCAIVAMALLGLWLVETLQENGFRRSRPFRTWLANAAIVGVGLLLAALVVHGPGNDAVSSLLPRGGLAEAGWAILHPGLAFHSLAGDWPPALLSLLLFGCLLSFWRQPGLFLAGLAGLAGLSVFFTIGYPGSYRHTSMWLLLLIALAWIAEERRQRTGRMPVDVIAAAGQICVVVLLALQVLASIETVISAARSPWSNSRQAAAILKADPRLKEAIVTAEPDFLVEPLRYYGVERTYLLRENRFGHAVNFTRNARLTLSLGEVLAEARRLQRETGSEVVILISQRTLPDPDGPPRNVPVGYNWHFMTTPTEATSFLEATERLATLTGSVQGEDYTLYRLR